MPYTAVKKRKPKPEARIDAIVNDNLQLVRRLAWHVHARVSSSAELEELTQVGMVALVEAARAFEDRGFGFATYASVKIKGAMIDHLRRSAWRARRTFAARREVEAARHDIESTRSGRATPPEIAERLGVSLDAYFQMESDMHSGTQEALEDVYSDSAMTFCDAAEPPDAVLDRAQTEKRVRDALSSLDQRSQLVLQLYFFEQMNLEEIGRVMDVGAARVCQIKKAALEKLNLGGLAIYRSQAE